MHRTSLRLKGCPKCGGDILIDKILEDGEVCIQCGFRNFNPTEQSVDPQSLVGSEELKINGK